MMPSTRAAIWRWITEPLSERVIRSAERSLGIEFPSDYRACVRDNHGGAPEPAEFVVDLGHGRRLEVAVGLLLTLDSRQDENVVASAQELTIERRLPPGLIPIIDDGNGGFVCLDYRSDESKRGPSIAYFSLDNGVVTLAHDFTEFLGLLGTTRV